MIMIDLKDKTGFNNPDKSKMLEIFGEYTEN